MTVITLFGSGTCPACDRAKEYLQSKDVDYEYVSIDAPSGFRELQEKVPEAKSIPVLKVDEEEAVIGFNNVLYDRALE